MKRYSMSRWWSSVLLVVALAAGLVPVAAVRAGFSGHAVRNFGTAPALGAPTTALNAPLVDAAAHPRQVGYWLLGGDGGIFSYGAVRFWGSTGGMRLNKPVVGIAAHPRGEGYWLVASDGGVFSFGHLGFFGSMGGRRLNAPMIGMAARLQGDGYWLVASDGGVFTFGRAGFHGSLGGRALGSDVVGIAATPTGRGYVLAAADGRVFSFGDAPALGPAPHLAAPIVDLEATPTGTGVWLLARDGAIYTHGDARYRGGANDRPTTAIAVVRTPAGGGYWIVTRTSSAPALRIRRGRTDRPAVALSFDAGSDAGFTARILDTLRASGLRASFALTGRWIEANPALARRIVTDGHHLMNHSATHPSFTGVSTSTAPLSTAARQAEVQRADAILQSVAGRTFAGWFRPPYGDTDDSVDRDLGAIGYRYDVLWTVDSLGWRGLDPAAITERTLAGAVPGAILMFHVGAASRDADALPAIIAGLRARGLAIGPIPSVVPAT